MDARKLLKVVEEAAIQGCDAYGLAVVVADATASELLAHQLAANGVTS